MKDFSSPLAPRIEGFLQLKRAMGRRYETAETELRRFDRYVASLDPPPDVVTRDLAHAWLQARPGLGPRSLIRRGGILRQFCLYSARMDPSTYVPEPRLLPATAPIFRAHIFSEAEVRALVRAALAWSPHGWSIRPQTYSTIVLVLFATGLRRAEICRLRLADVDLEANTLFVHRTKFFKSRLVPFSAGLSARLRSYLACRMRLAPVDPHAPFFLGRRRRAIGPRKLSTIFHELIKAAGIVPVPGRPGPRLHDMRHTFAVGRLLRWYREGANVQAKLSLLATYLGHGNPQSTQVYLNATPELLREASRRFEHGYGALVAAPEEVAHEGR